MALFERTKIQCRGLSKWINIKLSKTRILNNSVVHSVLVKLKGKIKCAEYLSTNIIPHEI